MVIRIMIMVPIYAISSLVSLHSIEAAFFIDAIRDIYEVRRLLLSFSFSIYILCLGICHLLLL
jgi:Organic solute transporter Ostalpha